MAEEECPICMFLNKCKEFGDESFCKKALKELDNGKITEEEFIKIVREKFKDKIKG